MSNEVVKEYFKKEIEGDKILIQLNPHDFTGVELLVSNEGQIQRTERQFDEEIYEDLTTDDFVRASALEFNLILKGLSSK